MDMASIVYVGMDVDKEKIAVAILFENELNPRIECIIKNNEKKVKEYFTKLSKEHETVLACYEAGSSGFVLFHQLTECGVACMVVAPGSIPKRPNDRIKTDRRDARKLAQNFRNGSLTGVYIPTRQDEAIRDYLRMHEDMKTHLKRAKQQLLHFLLRYGISYSEGTNWTGKHRKWLENLEFKEPLLKETFTEYYIQIEEMEEKCNRYMTRIEELSQEKRYAEKVKVLKGFKGVETLTALSVMVEIGDFKRFSHAESFMSFVGLVPSEHSSGNKRRLGGITKAGNSHIRKLLIEAGWHSRSYHPNSKRLQKRREGLPPEIIAYVNKAGRRLNRKYMRLIHNGKPTQVAATAAARELAGFIWGAMVGKVA